MAIEYATDSLCPRIRCDGCKDLIEDGVGNVFWPEKQGQASTTDLTFMHKACPDGVSRGWRASGGEDLAHFLVFLTANSGVDYTKVRTFSSAAIPSGHLPMDSVPMLATDPLTPPTPNHSPARYGRLARPRTWVKRLRPPGSGH